MGPGRGPLVPALRARGRTKDIGVWSPDRPLEPGRGPATWEPWEPRQESGTELGGPYDVTSCQAPEVRDSLGIRNRRTGDRLIPGAGAAESSGWSGEQSFWPPEEGHSWEGQRGTGRPAAGPVGPSGAAVGFPDSTSLPLPHAALGSARASPVPCQPTHGSASPTRDLEANLAENPLAK